MEISIAPISPMLFIFLVVLMLMQTPKSWAEIKGRKDIVWGSTLFIFFFFAEVIIGLWTNLKFTWS
jgi:Co/Zn/Cd efflux system component